MGDTACMGKRLSLTAYREGILRRDRVVLARALTLVESRLPADQELAQQLLDHLLPHTGRAVRIGITGVPGVGKSSFIEAFGTYLTGQGKPVAVLAVDPSSVRSRGSILGDKTRMENLARNPLAYIRPTPAGQYAGGVASYARESLLLCEAAGFEVILVETVGVGQAETQVQGMVDFFMLLLLAGAGDELQGLKRGIMEMADMLVITKADAASQTAVQAAQTAYQNALYLFPPAASGWLPPVLTASAHERTGLEEIWQKVGEFLEKTRESGYFEQHRQQQRADWLLACLRQELESRIFAGQPAWLDALVGQVSSGQTPPRLAARQWADRLLPHS